MLQEQIEAIKKAQRSFHLDLNFKFRKGREGIELLAEAIKVAKVPLTLDLKFNNLGDDDIRLLAGAIKAARYELSLELSSNNIGKAGVALLAEAIEVVQVPLSLGLGANSLGDDSVALLAEAIKVAQAPIVLHLDLNNIEETGARLLAGAMKVVQVPLGLGLSFNNIEEAGAKWLAEAIKVAKVPLKLDLERNNIKEAGARQLAEAIRCVRFPLFLGLNNNNIGNAGSELLAEAIKEAQVIIAIKADLITKGDVFTKSVIKALKLNFLVFTIKTEQNPFMLDLNGQNIGDDGAKLFAKAIEYAQAPLILRLGNSRMGNVGVKALVEAIKKARVPLNLDLSDNKVSANVARLVDESLKNNFVVDAISNLPRFLKLIGLNLKGMIEHQLCYPSVLADIVCGYLSNGELAWTAVTTIRSIEGASRDNKYSSIDWKLLNNLYPGCFSGSQSTLEVNQAPLKPSWVGFIGSTAMSLLSGGANLFMRPIREIRDLLDFSTTQFLDVECPAQAAPNQAVEPYESKCDNSSIEYEGNITRSDSSASVNEESSSSSSSGSPPPGGGAIDSAESLDRVVDLSVNAQSVNYEHREASERSDYNGAISDAETLLKTLFAWIKDLSDEQQHKIMSSFSMVLELLEGTVNPHKFIADQLSDKPVSEVFEKEYSDLYGLISAKANETDQASQEYSMPISIETNLEILGKGIIADPLLIGGSVSL
jgi:hypothetical protein